MNNTISAKEYCDRVFDGTHESPKASEQGRPLITSKNIVGGRLDKSTAYNISEKDYLDIQGRSYVSQWDILFSMIGSVGATYLERNSEIDYAVKNVGVFSCLDEARAKWLYYYLNSATAEKIIQNQLSGAVQKFLSLGALRDFPVPVYDKSKKPALDLLSTLDAKISLNHRINGELEGMAKLLYDYWFVQFDFPMSAAQAAADGKPRLAGQPYQSSGGKMTYHPTLKREIPVGWSCSELGEIFNLYQPQTITEKDLKADGEYFVYGANGIVGKYDRFNHEAPKIALTCRGSTCGNLTRTMPFSWITGNAMVMDPKDSSLDIEYVYNVAKASGIDAIITGSGQPQITRTNLEGVRTISPDSAILKRYQDFAAPITKQRISLEQQNQHLTALRDWLLPMLMNGQVTVR